jgi:TonB family protein
MMASASREPVIERRIALVRHEEMTRLLFLQSPGSPGGGGGGGRRQSQPPSRAQGIGHDQLTLTVAKPITASEQPADRDTVVPMVVLGAQSLAFGTTVLPGLPDAPHGLTFSLGSGEGGGVGDGRGSGVGSGAGPGLGPGSGGGFGGGVHRVGNGVVAPTLLRDAKPRYTVDAMRRHIEGTVALEVIVGADGVPIDIRVLRSLDPGLDEEAVVAVREWRFVPGRIGETPVNVLVNILLEFHIQ